jgi:hypothetical protein
MVMAHTDGFFQGAVDNASGMRSSQTYLKF